MASEAEGPKQLPVIHGHKSLLKSEALYQYILETSVYPREPEAMKELRHITVKHPGFFMAAAADQLQFMSMLLKLINARKTLEIGVLAIDVNRKYFDLGFPVIQKAGVAHKIDFREGLALPILDEILEKEEHSGSFDFAFVDAEKRNYINYHERVLKLVRMGGVIGYDNTLWGGFVVVPPGEPIPEEFLKSEPIPEEFLKIKDLTVEFNKFLAADPRIEICQLSIADGFTLCRRIH
ncbi:hypothetical protein OPV22_011305 [Ensete ventricosum]|uniref:Caffeoyl-CoA O-methyltransferase n=1 Tax=Ensete ventricosum TaxID=4639 RepID=A0AAV8R9D7_ENSVE|nr:hypothetical protein OPV22_011305 [Ensete ventricosum]